MTKHTQGPWIKPEGSMGIWKDKNTQIAIVKKNHYDAYLIAAAPELLDACQSALNYMLSEDNSHIPAHVAIHKLKTALGKALSPESDIEQARRDI